MLVTQTELLFPPHLIPELAEVRGPAWRDLVTATAKLTETSLEQAAFVLMMARLVNCAACNPNSHRSTQGCADCSLQGLKRFHGPDEELLRLFETAKSEVKEYINQR